MPITDRTFASIAERQIRLLCEEHNVGTCPCCGGPPRLTGGGMHFWKVNCESCWTTSGEWPTPTEAAAAWNRRPQPGSA
jgi:hypothetical protein